MAQPQDPRQFGINDQATDISDFPGPKGRGAAVNARIFTRVPDAKELGEGEHAYSVVAGIKKLHVKIQGVVASTTLT